MAITFGTELGPYRVLAMIGSGGMGEVYLAMDTRLNRRVALKVLKQEFVGSQDRLRRFELEARAASALNHPNIPAIHEIGSSGSAHYIAIEFIEGQTLRERLTQDRLNQREVLDIAIQTAGALAAAHAAGIVHQDIKPENIMLSADGYAKVLDFGLAKFVERQGSATHTDEPEPPGIVMGSVSYMSPEQARGLAVDARTDIFSFGTVMYEMTAGRVPFKGSTPSQVISDLLFENPKALASYSPDIPPELERIVTKALAKDREDRYQNIGDALTDLQRLRQRLDTDRPMNLPAAQRPRPPQPMSMPQIDPEIDRPAAQWPPPPQTPPPRMSIPDARMPPREVTSDTGAPAVASSSKPVPGRPKLKGLTATVWYGTNRKLSYEVKDRISYSSERDDRLHLGQCRVYVPEHHKIGSLGSPWWKRLLTRRDDRLKLVETTRVDSPVYWQNVRAAFHRLRNEDRMALIYLHGFNVTFEEAALRAAQLGCDLGIRGITAFYSWPSKGTLFGYEADGAAIEASEDFIAEFFAAFAAQSGSERVHVIAHSMGNRGLIRAIHRILGQAERTSNVKFGQIFLAAPDIDTELFTKLADCYPRVSQRTTLYICDKDKALKSSGILHDFPRAGFTPPVTVVPGIDTIEVSNIDLTWLGHGFFANARDVLHDMHDLIMHNNPPYRRMGLRRNDVAGKASGYWTIGA